MKINAVSNSMQFMHNHGKMSAMSTPVMKPSLVSFGGSPNNYVEAVRAVLCRKPDRLNPDIINRFVMTVLPSKKRESSIQAARTFSKVLEQGQTISRKSISAVTDEISDAVSKVTQVKKLPDVIKDKLASVVSRVVDGEKLSKSELNDLREDIINVAFKSTQK